MPCTHEIVSAAALALRFHPARPARDGIRIERVCILCGHLPELAGLILHPHDQAALRATTLIGTTGDAVQMAFPSLTQLATDRLGASLVVQTEKTHRIDGTVKSLKRDYVLGLLKRAMPFRQETWPRAVDCPGLGHPVIIHPGLREKFADRRDADHVRFAYYLRSVIAHPFEIWEAEDQRVKYHILGTLQVGAGFHHMIVVAEADNHICDTAYAVDRAERIEGYRTGRLLYAGWQLVIEKGG
jgi:hypothetical protein